jgi:ATP-binding cassette subfamily F protein 3
MQSVGILIQVLKEYEGTFIIVSHDRYFLSEIANKIWWIEDHHIKEYPGPYDEFEYSQEHKKNQAKAEQRSQQLKDKQEKEKQKKEAAAVKVKPEDDEQRKLKKKLNSRFQQLEEDLKKLKKEKDDLEKKLAEPSIYGDPASFQSALSSFNEVDSRLKDTTEEWERLFEQLSDMG